MENKKVMKKKAVTLLLIASIAALMLTGCGRSNKSFDSGIIGTNDAVMPEGAVDEVYEWEAELGTEENTTVYDRSESDLQVESEQKSSENGVENQDYLSSCYEYSEKDKSIDSSNEEYSDIVESGFSSVLKEPLSTFSADVDTASYSNLRRMIRDGYGMEDIPSGSVRIEEMLNYFTYQYNAPKKNEPFGVTTEIATCPWNADAELLMLGLQTEEIDYADAPPSNLVFLIDVSGSMYDEDKLPLLQESFAILAENLTERDRISIVTYAGSDEVLLNGVKGNKTKKIVDTLMSMEASGGTNGSQGIITAYELAQKNFIKGGNNRVILATDGDLNIGLTSIEELEELISDKKESGVYLSVLGFGTGNIKDNIMETLADKGNGNYAYIDSLKEADKVLVKEMGATLLTICKDVKFQVEFNPSVVKAYRLIGYENRRMAKEDFADDQKDAGEIGAGHSVTALYEIILCDPISQYNTKEVNKLKYKEDYKKAQKKEGIQSNDDSSAFTKEWLTVSIRYKKPSEDTSKRLDYPVGYDSYKDSQSDDFTFAAAVAEFGLLVTDSENKEEANISQVTSTLKKLSHQDEYKIEFYQLVKEIQEN